MTAPSEIAVLDAVGTAELVRRGEVSTPDLTRWAIERIEALNPTLNAVITPMYEQALAAAARVPREAPLAGVPFLRQGPHHRGRRRPLHRGFPLPARAWSRHGTASWSGGCAGPGW